MAFAILLVFCAVTTADLFGSIAGRAVAARLFPSLFPGVRRYGVDTGFADFAYD